MIQYPLDTMNLNRVQIPWPTYIPPRHKFLVVSNFIILASVYLLVQFSSIPPSIIAVLYMFAVLSKLFTRGGGGVTGGFGALGRDRLLKMLYMIDVCL